MPEIEKNEAEIITIRNIYHIIKGRQNRSSLIGNSWFIINVLN